MRLLRTSRAAVLLVFIATSLPAAQRLAIGDKAPELRFKDIPRLFGTAHAIVVNDS